MATATKTNLDSNSLFRSKNRKLADHATAILEAERPMTLRQLFYRLVSAGEIKNKSAEYKRLGSIMTRLREAKHVPLDWIVDHIRATLKPSSWTGLADFGDSVRDCYRKDFWAKMPVHVEVFVEKDAIAGTIQPVTDENDIRLHVCRGYASVSFAGGIAHLWNHVKKPIHAYYVGDFDPSGFDIERDLKAKLSRYSRRTEVRPHDCVNSAVFTWTRLAVRQKDFETHNLVRLPVKHKDNRAAGFCEVHGNYCAEVDALPPTELRRRVDEAISSHIDVDEWNRLLEVEQAEQETLKAFVLSMKQGA
jgi:hypothetical protein